MQHSYNKLWRYAPLSGFGYVAVFLVGLFISTVGNKTAGGYPSPWSLPEHIQAFYSSGHGASAISSVTQMIAAVLLLIFVTVLSTRLSRANGFASRLIFAGGSVSVTFLFISAICSWLLSRPEIYSNISSLRSVQDLAFAAGGVGYAVSLVLFVGATLVVGNFLPRWLLYLSELVVVSAYLSVFTFVAQGFSIFLPIARFSSFVWVAFVAWRLFTSVTYETDH
jgi:hypothetical protein